MSKTKLTTEDFKSLHLLSQHGSANAPHKGRFHNFAADFEDMFPTPVGHTDQRDDYRSALSPTAYFVDLVRLVSEHIKPSKDDRLALPKRRPDIFELELSREKAEKMVPYLEIANSVMRTYLEVTWKNKSSALERLAQSHFPFPLPFNLPLTQIRTYLQHFQIDLADIYAAFRLAADDPAWVAETLNLAPSELTYLATPDATPTGLSTAYGVTIGEVGEFLPLGGVDKSATFLAQTDITQEQSEILVRVNVPGEPLLLNVDVTGQALDGDNKTITLAATPPANADYNGLQITIREGKGSGQTRSITAYESASRKATVGTDWDTAPDQTSKYAITWQSIVELNLPALDFLNRFIRLANRLGWSFDDLNWALTSIRPQSLKSNVIDRATLNQLAKIKHLHDKYKLPIDVLCSFWSGLRTTPRLEQPKGDSLFDRVFKTSLFATGNAQDKATESAITLAADDTNADHAYSGLQITITAGTGAGQTRTITAYDGAKKIATVDTAWETIPDKTSQYFITYACTLGLAQEGAKSTIKLSAAASSVDHAYSGLQIAITAGMGAGQTRTITAYDDAKKIATVDTAWETIPDKTSQYFITYACTLGLAQEGAKSTIKLSAAASSVDHAYSGLQIAITAGMGAGQTRTITAYDGAKKVATVNTGWGSAPDATSQFVISAAGDHSKIRAALLGALKVDDAACNAILNHLIPLAGGSVTLDLRTLTQLFCLSKMAQTLGMPVAEYLALLKLVTKPGADPTAPSERYLDKAEVCSVDDAVKLANWADWLSTNKLTVFQLQYLTSGKLSAEATRVVGQALTPSAATTAVNNYLQQIDNWAVKPADFAHGGVDAKLAESIKDRLVTSRLLDDNGLVIKSAAALTEDAVKEAIGYRVFALAKNGGLYVSDFNGTNWTQVQGLGTVAVSQVVTIDGLLFALTKSSGLYLSGDKGTTWTRVSGMGTVAVNEVVASGKSLYAATASGLYISENNGTTWTQVKELEALAIEQVVASGNRLFVLRSGALYGRESNGPAWPRVEGVNELHRIYKVVAINNRLFAAARVEGAGEVLWVGDDDGTTWASGTGLYDLNPFDQIIAFGDHHFAAVNAKLYHSDANGRSWTPLSLETIARHYHLVAIDKRLFAIAGYGGTPFVLDLNVSDVNARSWTPLSKKEKVNFYINQVFAVGKCLFAGTSTGLYTWDDNRTKWTQVAGLEKYSITQIITIDNPPLIASALNTLQDALAQQTEGTKAIWSGVLGTDSAIVNAALTYVTGVNDQAQQKPIAGVLVQACRVAMGTARDGDVGTITLADDATKDAYAYKKDHLITITTGTGAGQTRTITQYEEATKLATVDTPWQTVPDSKSHYVIVDLAVVDQISLLLYLAKAFALSTQQFQSILNHAETFGLPHSGAVIGSNFSLDALHQIAGFKQLTQLFARQGDAINTAKDLKAETNDPQANSAEGLLRYLQNLQASSDTDTAKLSLLSGWEPDQIVLLEHHLAEMTGTLGLAQEGTTTTVKLAAAASNANNAYSGMPITITAGKGAEQTRNISAYDGAKKVATVDPEWVTAPDATSQYAITVVRAMTAKLSATSLTRPISHLVTMQRCFDLAAKLGIHIQLLIDLCKLHTLADEVDNHSWNEYVSTAQAFLGVVRSKYRPNEWSKVFAPIRDHLNEQERDALAAFLLRQLQGEFPDIKTRQDLYEFLLVDVEMSGCARTTYIKEAIDCLQVYIQRCRMNMEKGVTLSTAIPDVLWDWMGHFRLWQANRKIFFYPENYLDPTLRTREATPEFKALQSELLQGDVNKDTVEQAYIHYFDKLEELANLEIVNGCHAKVANPNSGNLEDTVFLIGRTATEPPIYYQRRALLATDSGGELNGKIRKWSPWQKIDVNVPADHALALYANDRLHIFWVEQRKVGRRDENDKKLPPQFLATVRFSYQQIAGNWVHPQALAKDVDVATLPRPLWTGQGGHSDGSYLFLAQPPAARTPEDGAVLSAIGPCWSSTFQRFQSSIQSKSRGAHLFQGIAWFGDGAPWQKHAFSTNVERVEVIEDRLYACTQDSGLWEWGTNERGGGWTRVSSLKAPCVSRVGAIGDRLYACTIRKGNELTESNKAGLWESVDHGATWAQSSVDFKGVTDVTVYQVVAVETGVYACNDFGLWSRKQDGKSWEQVDLDSCEGKLANRWTCFQLVATHDRLFLCTYVNGLCESSDGGKTWARVTSVTTPWVNRVVAVGDRLFACAAGKPGLWEKRETGWVPALSMATNQVVAIGDRIYACTDQGLWFSTDGATTWTRVEALGLLSVGQLVAISNRLYAFGSHLTNEVPLLYQSLDNGATWAKDPGVSSVRHLAAVGLRIYASTDTGLWEQDFELIQSVAIAGESWLTLPHGSGYLEIRRTTTSCLDPLRKRLLTGSLGKLLESKSQELPEAATSFASNDRMDFSPSSAFALYFSEIFFHIPYLIGDTLQTHRHFEEAKRWYEYIFNPLTPPNPKKTEDPSRFWQYKPFRDLKTLKKLTDDIKDTQQIRHYKDDPFDPFAIAQFRMGAYEKAVAMAYIDNLLAWGDSLYAMDGWENLNAATTLYVLAAELLGPRPQPGPRYTQVNGRLKAKHAHNDVHQPRPDLADILKSAEGDSGGWTAKPFFDVPTFFFLPENDQFAGYWNTVEKRLYQIRHCMNLQGIVRQLPLFQPPIDPRQLMRAVAVARSIASVTTGTAVHVPHYRFTYLLERARQVTSELKQLGGALLSALEKQDAEHLAVLRNTYEGTILNLTTLIKQKQQEETQHSLEGLQQNLASATARHERYQGWANQRLSPGEQTGLSLTQTASDLRNSASLITQASAIAYAIPNIYGLADGGANYGKAVEVGAGVLNIEASILEWAGQLALSKAVYDRRQADWQLQADLANYDVQQINAQVDALNVRQAMVDQELAIHQQSITQNQEIDQYYKQKFTSQELYQWMVGRLGVVYFQTYQLALDLARMTELAFQYERNTDDCYVNVNGWDGLKKGLLAGEALALNLNQLEKAYIEQNGRELEIEKTISLLQLNPQALLDFKNGRKCIFNFSEALFDLDFPGHYLRKIKTISLSIPAVVGPYQTVQATLIQQSNKVVLTPEADTVKFLLEGGDQPDNSKLRVNWRANQQIALSRGVNDPGMFELNFRDERYLPFEGTGAVSTWELRMPRASNPIDYDSISDVIITLRYTARDGGDALRQELLDKQSGAKTLQTMSGYRLFTVRQLNSAGWQALKNGTQDSLELSIGSELFPRNMSDLKTDGQEGQVKPIALYAWPEQNGDSPQFSLTLPEEQKPLTGTKANVGEGWEFTPSSPVKLVDTKWKIQLVNGSDAKKMLKDIDDILLIVPFQGDLRWGWLSGPPNA